MSITDLDPVALRPALSSGMPYCYPDIWYKVPMTDRTSLLQYTLKHCILQSHFQYFSANFVEIAYG